MSAALSGSIRRYQDGDHVAIADIFTRAVHETAAQFYTPQQCEAWSQKRPTPEHWHWRCETKQPFVFVHDEDVVGFLELDDDGHIDCLYVHPNAGRRGVATRLIDHALFGPNSRDWRRGRSN